MALQSELAVANVIGGAGLMIGKRKLFSSAAAKLARKMPVSSTVRIMFHRRTISPFNKDA
jgi:hypothetical protein